MTIRIFLAFFASIFMFYGCMNNEKSNIHNRPEIYIISPTTQDTIESGSLVEINAAIGDVNEVHDVTIKITSDYFTASDDKEIFYNHIHNTIFNVDTSFIAISPPKSTANYTLEIIAKDMYGISNSKAVKFRVIN